jgi:hypothetical protein
MFEVLSPLIGTTIAGTMFGMVTAMEGAAWAKLAQRAAVGGAAAGWTWYNKDPTKPM